MDTEDRYLRMSELTGKIQLNRRTVYRILKDDATFPRPIYVRPRSPRWSLSAVEAWLRGRQVEAAANARRRLRISD